ncbi:MAG: DUF4159 domain-containing protein [bacterium]
MSILRALPTAARALTAAALLVCSAGVARAQRGFEALRGDPPINNVAYDGRFAFARLRYAVAPGGYYYRGLPSWAHGYPNAEENLLRLTHEVSLFSPHLDGTNVVAINDPALFRYPVTYMTEAGYWTISDAEVAALRKYLLKGGFLILDDSRDGRFPGNMGFANIEANFRRIFPDLHFVDLTPAHPIFHSFFDIPSFDVVRQYYDYGPPVFRALFVGNNPDKRIMVLLNFNTDVSNYWEFSAQGFMPVSESNEAYKLGVNYIMYALTH